MQNSGQHYRLKKTEFQSEGLPGLDDASELLEEENKKLLCTNCNNHITNITEAISVNGAQTHTFTNPAGFTYTITCFKPHPVVASSAIEQMITAGLVLISGS